MLGTAGANPFDNSLEYGALLGVPVPGGAEDRIGNRGNVDLHGSG